MHRDNICVYMAHVYFMSVIGTGWAAFSDVQPQGNIHTANTIITNIILQVNKHNLTKCKMHTTRKLIPENIRHKIQQKNNIKTQNVSDPSITEFYTDITSLIQTQKSNTQIQQLDAHWNQKHNIQTFGRQYTA